MRLGDTSLRASRFGLGLAALGRPGYITVGHAGDLGGHTDVEAMRANAHAVLDAAYEPACATSTPLVPTAAPRSSWDRG